MPLLLSLLNAVRVRNCNLGAGLAFFLLLPVATAIVGAGSGVVAGLVFPRRGRLVAFAIPVLSILWSLLRMYLDPPVFAYDPFGGYFPGPIYDEALRPSGTLLDYRLCNLVWVAAALASVWTVCTRPNGGSSGAALAPSPVAAAAGNRRRRTARPLDDPVGTAGVAGIPPRARATCWAFSMASAVAPTSWFVTRRRPGSAPPTSI